MCEFCENSRIIAEDYTQYSHNFIVRKAVLSNNRSMRIKFEEMKPLHELRIEKIEIQFCPMRGRKLTETEK